MSADKPAVSVVIAAYNAAETLRPCVAGLLAQTLTDFELIVVDDGSTDGTPALLAGFAAADPRVRVLRQENAGPSAAAVAGCGAARAEFIARHDADDVSAPDRLEKQAAALRADPTLAAVGSFVEKVGPGGEPFATIRFPLDPVEATARVLTGRCNPVHGSVTFRRSVYETVGGYRPEFFCALDCELWLRLFAEEPGRRIAFLPEALYRWRWAGGSISTAMAGAQEEFARLAIAAAADRAAGRSDAGRVEAAAALSARVPELRRQGAAGANARRAVAAVDYHVGSGLYARGDRRAAGYLRSAALAEPWRFSAWAKWAACICGGS